MNNVPHSGYHIGNPAIDQAQHIHLSVIRGLLEQATSTVFAVPPGELRAPRRRGAQIAFARQVAMYLAHVGFGLSLTRVGALFGRDRTTVAHGCAIVEAWRELPARDRALQRLESALRAAVLRSQLRGGKPA